MMLLLFLLLQGYGIGELLAELERDSQSRK